jgi:hypothetical protein
MNTWIGIIAILAIIVLAVIGYMFFNWIGKGSFWTGVLAFGVLAFSVVGILIIATWVGGWVCYLWPVLCVVEK